MDYTAQIAIIIGKTLTFRHYPYPFVLYGILDVGFFFFSYFFFLQKTRKRARGINTC